MNWYEVLGLIVGIVSLVLNLVQWTRAERAKRVYTAVLVSVRTALQTISQKAGSAQSAHSTDAPASLSAIKASADTACNQVVEVLTRYSEEPPGH